MSEASKGNTNRRGKKLSKKTKNKISQGLYKMYERNPEIKYKKSKDLKGRKLLEKNKEKNFYNKSWGK